MKTIRVPVLVLILLGLLLLVSLGYGLTQQIQAEVMLREAQMQRDMSIAAQREAESQRQLAETHRVALERALQDCKKR